MQSCVCVYVRLCVRAFFLRSCYLCVVVCEYVLVLLCVCLRVLARFKASSKMTSTAKAYALIVNGSVVNIHEHYTD